MKIHFFHTNDVHSHLEEYLQVATQLRRRRAAAERSGDAVFTFEIGDHADRKRMETEGTLGRTNAALIRQVGYDAWVFGNNEGLTLPKTAWEMLANEAEVPVLIANLFDESTREPYSFFEPYLMFEREGVRVGADLPVVAEAVAARFGDQAGRGATGLSRPIAVLTGYEAKGLEFDAVVLADPDALAAESPRGAASLYVAMTRPTQRLTLVTR